MRKIYHFLLFCFISGVNTVYAQYTAVPDPHFEAYLEDNGMGDGIPGNGLVLTANIENVTELTIYGYIGITDLTGIEDFTALEVFYLSFNPITFVNLSQNSNLTHVGFSSTMLSTLDLSSNNKLEYAGGLYNLELDSLIVNSPYITQLDFWENHLIYIDVTNCPALEVLDVHYNFYLPALDVSNNPNLKTLRCGENNLSSLDVSNNPLLEVLSVGNNPNLTSIDLSHNPLLRMFTAGHNNSMAYIDARNGNNENFELFSANPATNLQCVYVDDAEASYLEDWSVPNHTQFANNEQECSAVSVDDYQRPVFSMYPNPAKERVTVISNSEGAYRIYSSEGKVVITGEITQGFNNIYLSDYPTGLYYLELESAEGKEIKRVVKE
jgi:hypothetical protein